MNVRRLFGIGVIFSALIASSQTSVAPATLPTLLTQFTAETDRAAKEKILLQITTKYPGAGPDLLVLAKGPENGDTKWMAIRGIGYLKFAAAVPFLESSLNSSSAFVRANSARSLGEVGDASAIDPLIDALSEEQDSGVIEQTALAFQMLHAKKALPVLKSKIGNPSPQTRIWVLDAVDFLGGRAELPFIADSLQDDSLPVRYHAAQSVQRLSGQDFGFPACTWRRSGPCGVSESAIRNAREWWSNHKRE